MSWKRLQRKQGRAEFDVSLNKEKLDDYILSHPEFPTAEFIRDSLLDYLPDGVLREYFTREKEKYRGSVGHYIRVDVRLFKRLSSVLSRYESTIEGIEDKHNLWTDRGYVFNAYWLVAYTRIGVIYKKYYEECNLHSSFFVHFNSNWKIQWAYAKARVELWQKVKANFGKVAKDIFRGCEFVGYRRIGLSHSVSLDKRDNEKLNALMPEFFDFDKYIDERIEELVSEMKAIEKHKENRIIQREISKKSETENKAEKGLRELLSKLPK
ncbi:MAG: hypothetical protein V1909_03855 [Candidatus Micrarchaeota archaeon]